MTVLARRRERQGKLLATQRALLEMHHALADPSPLNLAYALLVEGPLPATRLDAALRATVERHEALRTTYVQAHGRPVARVEVGRVPPLELVDLASRADVECAHETAGLALAAAGRAFDPARDLPLRSTLVRWRRDRHVLLLTFHHLAADGWSLGVFANDVSAAYRGGVLPPVPARQCLDAAETQAGWLAGRAAERERQWWRAYLDGVDGEDAGSSPEGREAAERCRRLVLPLPPGLIEAVEAAARRLRTTLYLVLLAAFAAVLSRWKGGDPLIGGLVAGRHSSDAAATMGAYYDAMLVRARVSGVDSFGRLVDGVTASTLSVLDKRLPYDEVATVLAEALGQRRAVAPRWMLLLDRHPLVALRLDGVRVRPLHVGARPESGAGDGPVLDDVIVAAYPAELTFFVRQGPGTATLNVLWPARLRLPIRALIAGFVQGLEHIARDPATPVPAGALPEPAMEDEHREPRTTPAVCEPMEEVEPVAALSPAPFVPARHPRERPS